MCIRDSPKTPRISAGETKNSVSTSITKAELNIEMKIKQLPKHVTSGINFDYSVSHQNPFYKRKGSHSTDKYNPHYYLRKSAESISHLRSKKEEGLAFYDYQICVKSAVKFPALTKGSRELTRTVDKFAALRKIPERTEQRYRQPLVSCGEQAKTEVCLKPVGAIPALTRDKSRRRWMKIAKRTVFNFELDPNNNSVSLTRIKAPGVEDEPDVKIKEKVREDGQNLSPQLQKKRGIEDRERRASIKVYYGTGSESPSRVPNADEKNLEQDTKKLLFKNKLTSNLKASMKLRKFLEKGPLETSFDMSRIKLANIDASSFFHLYLRIKRAIAPTFYNTGSEELNKIDPDVIEEMQTRAVAELNLTEYDQEALELYREYIEKAGNDEILSGFWKTKKVHGYRPICRESPTFISMGGNHYMFGGYGVDRMNDLWCLETRDEALNGNYRWTQIHPLGREMPTKRHGHCMAGHNNEIYVFGGSPEFVPGLKMRIVLDDMWKYSIAENRWYNVEAKGGRMKGRMHAASCTIDHTWFIHGGTDGSSSNILSSSAAYSIDTGKFLNLMLTKKVELDDKVGPLAMHSAVAVVPVSYTHLTLPTICSV
eukprot:TRINITY_DN12439_c0_g1_i1.p1 TRINITY_DN12439_c0_g1~~TRINITY_DN12439_c0_g1_i1.p1  ORF type:complete len:597 (-),score=130.44 TRINITY_DN12439_c0_g1_i1:53-1843(-)